MHSTISLLLTNTKNYNLSYKLYNYDRKLFIPIAHTRIICIRIRLRGEEYMLLTGFSPSSNSYMTNEFGITQSIAKSKNKIKNVKYQKQESEFFAIKFKIKKP